MSTRPNYKSNSNVKLTNTTKKRLEGCDPAFKNDCSTKQEKNKKYTNQFK
ncbi:hypothetical protein [Paraclostridium bifermentans]